MYEIDHLVEVHHDYDGDMYLIISVKQLAKAYPDGQLKDLEQLAKQYAKNWEFKI